MVPGHKRALSDTSVGSSEDERHGQNTPTLESVTERVEPERKHSLEDEASDKTSDVREPEHPEVEKMNGASASDTSTEGSRSGEETIPVTVTSEEEQPIPPATGDAETVLEKIVSEETGEEEKNEVKAEELEEKTEQPEEMQKIEEIETPFTPEAKEESDQLLEREQKIKPDSVPEKADIEQIEKEMHKEELVEDESTVTSPGEVEEKLSQEATKAQDDVEEKTEDSKPEDVSEIRAKPVPQNIPTQKKEVDVEEKTSVNEMPVVVINGAKEEEVIATEEVNEDRPETQPEHDRKAAPLANPDVEKEKDSDSGSSSAADTNSIDINLSISSFMSKSKEGSVSIQVPR